MKNMRKVIILFIAISLLASCGWNDVKNFSNFTCTYKADSDNKMPLKTDNSAVNRIRLSKTDTNINIQFGTDKSGDNVFSTPLVMINSDETTKTDSFGMGGSTFKFTQDVMKTLGQNYTQNKTCPAAIYFTGKSNKNTYTLKDSCSGDYCFKLMRDDNLSTTELSQTDNNRFSWECEYSFKTGAKVKYKVYNLEATYIKNPELVTNVAKNYFSVYYKKNGSYTPLNGSVKDFDGSAGTGWGNPSLSSGVSASSFIQKSIKNEKISCPTLYLESFDAVSCMTITDYIFTTVDKSYHCDGFTEYPNTPVSPSKMTCKNETTGASSSNCDTVVTHEDLHDEDEVTCKYSTGYNSKFAMVYNKTSNTLTYQALATGFTSKIIDADKLKQEFATTSNHDHCPTYLKCKAFNTNSKKKIYIAPWETADFVDDDNKTRDFDKNCGILNGENGQEVTDPTEHYVLELQESNLDISDKLVPCDKLMGKNLIAVLHLFVTAVRIVGAIIAIISGMLALIPAVASDDASAIKKATKKCIYMAIILVAIGIFPSIIKIIGKIARFDLTCITG